MGNFNVIQKGTTLSTVSKVTDISTTDKVTALSTIHKVMTLSPVEKTVTITKIAEQGLPGRTGSAGSTGPIGPMGPAGSGWTAVITQSIPSTIWVMSHNLHKYPSIVVVDSAGTIVEGDIEYLDTNTVQITFSGAFAGTAYFN